jgi:hypothetical protein
MNLNDLPCALLCLFGERVGLDAASCAAAATATARAAKGMRHDTFTLAEQRLSLLQGYMRCAPRLLLLCVPQVRAVLALRSDWSREAVMALPL